MDLSRPSALFVTTRVLELTQEAQAGDLAAIARLDALAELLEPRLSCDCPAPDVGGLPDIGCRFPARGFFVPVDTRPKVRKNSSCQAVNERRAP